MLLNAIETYRVQFRAFWTANILFDNDLSLLGTQKEGGYKMLSFW